MKEVNTEYHNFLKEVIIAEMDKVQLGIFEMEGEDLIAVNLSGNTAIVSSPVRNEYGLAPEAVEITKEVIDVVILIISTSNLILEVKKIYGLLHDERLKRVKERWKEELVKLKIKPEVADKLVTKYATKFLEALSKL